MDYATTMLPGKQRRIMANRKLNDEQIKSLKFDFKRGLSYPELCNIYGICKRTVVSYLGDCVRGNTKGKSTTEFRNKALIADFQGGLVSLKLLSEKYSILEKTVRKILIDNNIIEKPTMGYGIEMKRKVITLREKGVKVKDIPEQLGVSFDYTRKVITEYRKKIGVYTGKAGKPSDNPKPRNVRKGRAYGDLRKAIEKELAELPQGQTPNRAELARKYNSTRQRISQLVKALS